MSEIAETSRVTNAAAGESIADCCASGWPTFDEMLACFQVTAPWIVATDFDGFFGAAVEASNLQDGRTLLIAPQSLSFDASLTVQYLGEGGSDDGCFFDAFLFRGYGFDVFIWIEDDLHRARLVWGGDENAYLRAELMLRMFEGRTLSHLR